MASGKYATDFIGGTADALDYYDGAGLAQGDIAIVQNAGTFYPYMLEATSAAPENSPLIIAPDFNAGDKRWVLQDSYATPVDPFGLVPSGGVIPVIGGYFTGGGNSGFTSVIGNTVSALNTLYNSLGYYACDGSALNLSGSPIYDGPGRYLPDLTDDRFIMGDTAAGGIGGSNTMAHTHTVASHTHTIAHTHTTGNATLSIAMLAAHSHTQSSYPNQQGDGSNTHLASTNTSGYTNTSNSTGSGSVHNHGTTGASGTANSGGTSLTTSAASNTENRAKFLAAIYMQRAI